MEFKEYSNPEGMDYDINSSLRNSAPNFNATQYNKYDEQLLDLIGILGDITEEELLENYGISMQEYLNPTAETLKKVSEKLHCSQDTRHR